MSPGGSGRPSIGKVPACIACRSLKIRCLTEEDQITCRRCLRLRLTCERPQSNRLGRPPGSRNIQTPLERAFKIIQRQFEHANRSREGRSASPDPVDRDDANEDSASFHPSQSSSERVNHRELYQRFSFNTASAEAYPECLPSTRMYESQSSTFHRQSHGQWNALGEATNSGTTISSLGDPISDSPEITRSHSSWYGIGSDDDNALANPVRILAEAAEEDESAGSGDNLEQLATQKSTNLPSQYGLKHTLQSVLNDGNIDQRMLQLGIEDDVLLQGLQYMTFDNGRNSLSDADKVFFKPRRIPISREQEKEFDPLHMALLTVEEATAFFDSFYLHLHPFLPILDPALHKPMFVHQRSLFLYSVICAHGASITDGAEEATRRLRLHTQRFAEMINPRSFASVEIIQGFLLWSSWLPSSEPFQEERLWHEAKYAVNMAIEIGLTEKCPESPSDMISDPAINPCLQGIDVTDPHQILRIKRNRQRLWLHLFLWESNLSLAFGKTTRFVQDDLIKDETWCYSPVATKNDRLTTASVVLRRRLATIFHTLRAASGSQPLTSFTWIAAKIEAALQPWYTHWMPECGQSPYLELVYRHTRLWCLSCALQGQTPRAHDLRPLQDACFLAAMKSCEFVCDQLRSSRQLWGMPNTVGPMLSFTVIVALRTGPFSDTEGLASRARLLGLLAQVALQLELVGDTPTHRLGTAAVYGRQLQLLIRKRTIALCWSHYRRTTTNTSQCGADPISVTSDIRLERPPLLPWQGEESVDFTDLTSQWTNDFFSIFGAPS